jgi:hypothetical protein
VPGYFSFSLRYPIPHILGFVATRPRQRGCILAGAAHQRPRTQNAMITEYELYTDERKEKQRAAQYLTIAGIICTDRGRQRLLTNLQNVRLGHGLTAEMRWTKISRRHVDGYKAWLDTFFDDPHARHVLLSVNQSTPEWRAFRAQCRGRSGGDQALASVYYQFLLIAFGALRDTKRWCVYPDAGFFSRDSVLDRVEFKFNRTYKRAFGPKVSRIIRLTRSLDSKKSDLNQLADILLGCAACDLFEYAPKSVPRSVVIDHFKTRRATVLLTQRGLQKLSVQAWVSPERFRYER